MNNNIDSIFKEKKIIKLRSSTVAEERVNKLNTLIEDDIFKNKTKHWHKKYGMQLLCKEQVDAFESLGPIHQILLSIEARHFTKNEKYLSNSYVRLWISASSTLFGLFFALTAYVVIAIMLGQWFVGYFYHNGEVIWRNPDFVVFLLFALGWILLVASAHKTIPKYLNKEIKNLSQIRKKYDCIKDIAERLQVKLHMVDAAFIASLSSINYHLGIRDKETMDYIATNERQVSAYMGEEPTVEELARRAESERINAIKALALKRARELEVAADQRRAAEAAMALEVARLVAIAEDDEDANFCEEREYGNEYRQAGFNPYELQQSYYPSVNVNGLPMIGNSGIDVAGNHYGSFNDC